MAYHLEKENDGKTQALVIDGWENGIAVSPHEGIANLQAVNITSESDEVMVNYARAQQSQTGSNNTGTLTPTGTADLDVTMTGVNSFKAGMPITISASTIPSLSTGNYYILSSVGTNIRLSSTFNGSVVTFTASGSASFTFIRNIGQPVASATEKYSTGSAFQYRYYILDANGLVWVQDTGLSVTGLTWYLPDTSTLSNATGMCVLNGWLLVFAGNTIWCKPTVILGATPGWSALASGIMMSPATSPNIHFALVGQQGKAYYTDGNFIGSIFPNTSLLSGVANLQSYAQYTASSTTGTLAPLIGGSVPSTGVDSTRIPAVFFSSGTKPAAITVGTIYYIQYSTGNSNFEVYAAASGGSAIDIEAGSSGNQYFNTFYPTSTGGKATIVFTPQRLNLPFYETATCLAELGNTIIVGSRSNLLYPWNQVDLLPSDLIPLPENLTVNMITVNNMVYVFSGNKGNVYITNGSTASLVTSVPDYCAGVPGTPSTYVEPYFSWGGAMYLRGRVWFSILDQTSTKAGNCGGVWSFVPTQNFYFGQKTGLALRQENQNSYGTYSGVATVLLASRDQAAKSPQYWSGWYSSVTSPTYGIDFTDTGVITQGVIETDLIPTGTLFDKLTFTQLEYKLSTPLLDGEQVQLYYRVNGTDAWATCGSPNVESTTNLSGVYPINFEKGQWLQLRVQLITNTVVGTNADFMRLCQLRVR